MKPDVRLARLASLIIATRRQLLDLNIIHDSLFSPDPLVLRSWRPQEGPVMASSDTAHLRSTLAMSVSG